MMSYFENEYTYWLIITQSEYEKYLPYIIRFLSLVFVPTIVIILSEKLIGIVYGSASAFILILGVVILFMSRKYFINDISNDFSFGSYSCSGVINDSDDDISNIDHNAANLLFFAFQKYLKNKDSSFNTEKLSNV